MPPQKTQRQNITFALDQTARLSLPCSAQPKPFPVLLLWSLYAPFRHPLFPCDQPQSCTGICSAAQHKQQFPFQNPQSHWVPKPCRLILIAAQPSSGMRTQNGEMEKLCSYLLCCVNLFENLRLSEEDGTEDFFIHQPIAAALPRQWSEAHGVESWKKTNRKNIDSAIFLFDHSFWWRQVILDIMRISEGRSTVGGE